MEHDLLFHKARHVLEKNWTGTYTRPAPRLYPHQWSWDSAFVAIGYSHFDLKKAQTELLSIFKGQWKNGMLPHIVYHEPSDEYFPDGDFWQTNLTPDAPDSVVTSGLTHPPIHATAVWYSFKHAHDKKSALDFLRGIFPNLLRWHRFLYSYRDPDERGLVANIHPWETGIDNSPKWDAILGRMTLDGARIPHFERKDLKFVASQERPSDDAYLKFVYLIELFKQYSYNQNELVRNSPFLVYDVLFNSVLCRANRDLLKIAELLAEETREIQEWLRQAKTAFDEILWDAQDGTFHSYDLRKHAPIRARTGSCALPLFAAIPNQKRASQLKELLHTVCPFHQEEICVAVPTYDRGRSGFDASNYWRGPIWVNINWMIFEGLLAYGFEALGAKIRRNMIRLVEQLGFCEYYYPTEPRGLGSKGFSWTAALVIDLLLAPRSESDDA